MRLFGMGLLNINMLIMLIDQFLIIVAFLHLLFYLCLLENSSTKLM